MAILRIVLFGQPHLEVGGVPREVKRRKVMGLLAYLAVACRPSSRDKLAELLYPQMNRDRAYAGLRQTLSYLKDEVGDGVLEAGPQGVCLRRGTCVVDAAEFREHLSHANGSREVEHLRSAVGLCRGDFLEGFYLRDSPSFEEWQTGLAEELRGQYVSALSRLHDRNVLRGCLEQAVEDARAIVSLDRLDESAQRRLMRTLAAAGRKQEAFRQYESLCTLLEREMHCEPEDETRELLAEIHAGLRKAAARPGGRGRIRRAPDDARRDERGTPAPAARGPQGARVVQAPASLGPTTFLFADASNATGEETLSALAELVGECGGVAFSRGTGRLHAAFAEASHAIQAALQGQLVACGRGRSSPGLRSMRVAVHTGPAERAGTSFAGPAVDRAECLLAAAHEGMVLVSGPAADQAAGRLPAGATLKSLGTHRMEDLGPPLAVHRLAHPELPSRFPQIRTLEGSTCNLRSQPTFLVGRQRELAAVLELVRTDGVRVATLTGPGGTGKTRLALHAAARLSASFQQGTWFVDLATVHRPSQVVPAIASALGVRESPGAARPLAELLAAAIGRREVLLVLDNFEHVLDAVRVVEEITAACPGVKVLATSREPLHLRGERELPIPPLELPEPGTEGGRAVACESARLFVERARAVRPDFPVTSETAVLICEICARLDGLPLAIELAAARTAVLDPRALLERLSSPMEILTQGAEDLPERQKTLRREVRWSYDLLTDEQRRLFRSLAVFPGGFTLDSAQAIWAPGEEAGGSGILDWLSALVEKSLLRRLQGDGVPRFRMLQTIREFALEELERSGESMPVAQRFADHAMETAEDAAPLLLGPGQGECLSFLDEESHNLSAALVWLEERGYVQQGLRIAGALGWYWFRRGRFSTGARWLEAFLVSEPGTKEAEEQAPALASSGTAAAAARARALYYLGWARLMLGSTFYGNAGALECFRRSLPLWRAAGDLKGEALSLVWVGWCEADLPEEQRTELVDRGVTVARMTRDPWTLSFCLKIAYSYLPREDRSVAEKCAALEESVALARQTGDSFLVCQAVHGMGDVYMFLREDGAAEPWYLDALERARRIDDSWSEFDTLSHLGYGRLNREDIAGATDFFADALRSAVAAGARSYVAQFLLGFSHIATRHGDARRALRLAGAAAVMSYGGAARYDPRLVESSELPMDAAMREWGYGAEMGQDGAVRLALGESE